MTESIVGSRHTDKHMVLPGSKQLATAKALAKQDAHVILAVKTKAKGDEAMRKI